MSYQVTSKAKGVVFDFFGPVSFQEVQKANDEWHANADLDSHRYAVWNFIEADASLVSKEDVEEVAAIDSAQVAV